MDTSSTNARLFKNRNNIQLLIHIDGEPCANFRLREFQNSDGLAMVHRSLLESLERLRRELCALARDEVWVIITDAIRTQQDLQRLALCHGWADQGGTVSRNSKHLVQFGGIAVDIYAVIAKTKQRIPQKTLGNLCRKFFDFVKDDYPDGHVHADNRVRAYND